MRRSDKKIEDGEIINKILTESVIYRLGLFDGDYPYIVPLNYGHKNNSLYSHCALHGKKLDLIRRNNKVCFEIEGAHEIIQDEISCNWTTKYRSIIGIGEIEIITGFDEKQKGLDIIMLATRRNKNKLVEKQVLN